MTAASIGVSGIATLPPPAPGITVVLGGDSVLGGVAVTVVGGVCGDVDSPEPAVVADPSVVVVPLAVGSVAVEVSLGGAVVETVSRGDVVDDSVVVGDVASEPLHAATSASEASPAASVIVRLIAIRQEGLRA